MVKTRENTDTQLTQYRRIHLSTCLHCYFATQWVFFPCFGVRLVACSWLWRHDFNLPHRRAALAGQNLNAVRLEGCHHVSPCLWPNHHPVIQVDPSCTRNACSTGPHAHQRHRKLKQTGKNTKSGYEKWIHRIGDLDDVCFVAGSYWEMMFFFQVLFRFRGFQRAELLECCEKKWQQPCNG